MFLPKCHFLIKNSLFGFDIWLTNKHASNYLYNKSKYYKFDYDNQYSTSNEKIIKNEKIDLNVTFICNPTSCCSR